MVKLAVFFAAIAVCIILGEARSSQNIDVKNFLQALQQQLQSEQKRLQLHQYDIDEQEDGYDSLKRKVLQRLPKYLSREEDQNQKLTKHRRPFGKSLQLSELIGSDHNDDRTSYETSNRALNDLDDNLNEYSKVYVIINADAMKKSQNKDKLNQLLSNLLVEPSQDRYDQDKLERIRLQQNRNRYESESRYQKKRSRYQDQDRQKYHIWAPYEGNLDTQERQEDNRYRDLVLDDNDVYRRRINRARDSGEDFEKPAPPMKERQVQRPRHERYERPRNNYNRGGGRSGRGGGGGGGAGGMPQSHTSIPYMNQRGDIYEKE